MDGHLLSSTGVASWRAALLGILLLDARARGDTVAFTSFEDPGALGDIAGTIQRIDSSGALTNELGRHNASHAAGSAGSGLELGFASAWITNANSPADSIGPVTSSGDTADLIGVTDLAPPSTNFTRGAFGFLTEDVDGELALVFDPVDLSGYMDTRVSLDLFAAATTWEASDYLRVVVSGAGTNLAIFDSFGLDLDDLGIEGAWTSLGAGLDGFGQATLRVVFSSNAADERFWIDNVVFSGTPIPEPSAALLLAAGACVLSLAFRRRIHHHGLRRARTPGAL